LTTLASAIAEMMGASPQKINGSCDLTTPVLGIISHPWSRTC